MRTQSTGRKRPRSALIVLLAAAVIGGGCLSPGDGGKKEGAPATSGTPAVPSGGSPSPAGAGGAGADLGKDVVVTVDGSQITYPEMRHSLRTDVQEKHQLLMAPTEEAYFLSFANRRALNRMLFLEAGKRGISPPDLERHMELDRMSVLKVEYMDNLYRSADVSAAAVEARAPRYWTRIRLQELLVEDEEAARAARKRLDAGESFDALVKEMSVGPSADKGGRMDFLWYNNGLFDPSQTDVLFGLKEGAVSPVMKTPLGYGQYKVLERDELNEAEKKQGYANIVQSERERAVGNKEKEIFARHKIWSIDEGQKPKEFFRLFEDWYKRKDSAEKLKDKVVARVDGFEIRYADVLYADNVALRATKELDKLNHFQWHRELLGGLVAAVVMSREADKNGYKASENSRIELGKRRELLTVQYFLDRRYREGVDLSDGAVRKYYQENVSRYSPGESASLLHLFVKDKGKTKTVRERLAQGEDFAAVASSLSEGYPLGTGPDAGFVNRKDLEGTVGKKIFGLAAGEVSGPIPYRDGYLLVKVIEKRRTVSGDFGNVQPQVRRDLERAQKSRIYNDLIRELSSKYRFALNEKEKPRFLEALAKERKRIETEKKLKQGLHHMK